MGKALARMAASGLLLLLGLPVGAWPGLGLPRRPCVQCCCPPGPRPPPTPTPPGALGSSGCPACSPPSTSPSSKVRRANRGSEVPLVGAGRRVRRAPCVSVSMRPSLWLAGGPAQCPPLPGRALQHRAGEPGQGLPPSVRSLPVCRAQRLLPEPQRAHVELQGDVLAHHVQRAGCRHALHAAWRVRRHADPEPAAAPGSLRHHLGARVPAGTRQRHLRFVD
ncbi:complement C1q tumor necrosis factor-related protein 8 isoform X1 [Zalophus californianus]|uniref:Complement C1q tumor necrosis factor-related protein 8 isoform X1 n=1 Tax=Zalophus californianus TaxID=9704 RepID=A0A6J2EH25_ZALCA|nr:complement C1q tumor necrosis factor-related protein 8 isoform X1 [Zalophus californianus]